MKAINHFNTKPTRIVAGEQTMGTDQANNIHRLTTRRRNGNASWQRDLVFTE